MHVHTSFVNLFRDPRVRRTRVTGAPIIGGLVPCNVIPDEILTDHPDRYRAMLVESANPAHSLADAALREAFEALELVVVIDVAMTETARHADYVLPAASQYEKPEATYFNFEFPENIFQLRRPLMEPLPGTLPEAEIWTRLVRATGLIDDDDLEPLRAAARESRERIRPSVRQARRRTTPRCPASPPASSTRRSAPRCRPGSRPPPRCGRWRSAAP